MPRRAAGAILLTLYCSLAGAADAGEPTPEDLLNRMSMAVKTANYDGIFTYSQGHQRDTLRVIHRGAPAPEYERLVSLTGLPREVIRSGDTVTTYYPDAQSVMVEKTRPRNYAPMPGPAASLSGFYTFALLGSDRVAGRAAWIVAIQPRDAWRYGYRIWIDQASFLPLRTELRGQAGAPIEEVIFTQLQVLAEVGDAELAPGISGQGLTWFHGAAAREQPEAGVARWRAAWLPPGFQLQRYDRQALVASGDPVEQIVYSDGMASVSVFVERVRDGVPQVGPDRSGGVSMFGRLARGHQVTAVGEVPAATVQRIANSMITE